MSKTAILVDGGFYRKRVESPLFQKHQLTHVVYVNKKD